MAKTKGPLFSISASGSIAKTLTYQKNGPNKIARAMPVPKKASTDAQDNLRCTMAIGVAIWKDYKEFTGWLLTGLTQAQKDAWELREMSPTKKGYWAFIGEFQRRSGLNLSQFQTADDKGFCLVGEWEVGALVVGGKKWACGD